MRKMLDELEFKKRLVSHLRCVKSCVKYLGVAITGSWLYGGTGHPFIINIHEDVDFEGVTAWNIHMLFDLASNLVYRVDGFKVSKREQMVNSG